MRLRNITGSREVIAASDYVVHEPNQYKGKWNAVFGNDHPLQIEIGMGKGRFMMDMSHDIRTPLNAIIGMVSIAQDNISDQSKLKDCLEKINSSSTHLLSLISDILDMSQIEKGKIILKEEGLIAKL